MFPSIIAWNANVQQWMCQKTPSQLGSPSGWMRLSGCLQTYLNCGINDIGNVPLHYSLYYPENGFQKYIGFLGLVVRMAVLNSGWVSNQV